MDLASPILTKQLHKRPNAVEAAQLCHSYILPFTITTGSSFLLGLALCGRQISKVAYLNIHVCMYYGGKGLRADCKLTNAAVNLNDKRQHPLFHVYWHIKHDRPSSDNCNQSLVMIGLHADFPCQSSCNKTIIHNIPSAKAHHHKTS